MCSERIVKEGKETRIEIMRLTAIGLSTLQIARHIGRSPKTVEYHKSLIAAEHGMQSFNVALIARRAVALSLVPAGIPSSNELAKLQNQWKG